MQVLLGALILLGLLYIFAPILFWICVGFFILLLILGVIGVIKDWCEKDEELQTVCDRKCYENIKWVVINAPELNIAHQGRHDGYVVVEDCDLLGHKALAVYFNSGEWIGWVDKPEPGLKNIVKEKERIPIVITIETSGCEILYVGGELDLNQ